MSTLPFDVDSLLLPLAEAAPSGPDLEYDPRFAELELSGAGKPERQYGEKVYPAEPPEWPTVYQQAMQLCGATRDLRVAMWVLRSSARLHGLNGLVAGLQLLGGLLDGLWDSVYPQLDTTDNNDPTMRLNALAPLSAIDAVLDDVRNAALVPVRGSLRVRELELGLGFAEPANDEAQPTEAGVMQALESLLEQHAGLPEAAGAALAAATAIESTLDLRLGQSHNADLAPLKRVLGMLTGAIARLRKPADGSAEAAAAAEAPTGAARVATGAIASRADAVRELERVCEWIERNEPTNPAPILIRRAQRLMNKSFMEIIRDMAPDGLAQIELLAGPDAQG